MSDLPGLVQPEDSTENSYDNTVELAAGQEFRFEVDADESISIELAAGSAELFGSELLLGSRLQFSCYKGAIYTWKGCSLKVSGAPKVSYVGEETSLALLLNLSAAISNLRTEAQAVGSMGPRVCIIGPEDAGKTSAIKTLAAYASRQEAFPLIVNLDPTESLVTPPGTLCAFQTPAVFDVESGVGTSDSSGPAAIPPVTPVTYFHGYPSPVDAKQNYLAQLSSLAVAVMSRLKEDPQLKVSGCLLDTSSVIDQKNGYEIIGNILSEFEVNVLVVMGSERLYSDMSRRYESQKNLRIVKASRSSGSVEREDKFIRDMHARAFRQYFYNTSQNPLNAYSCTLDVRAVVVYKLAESIYLGFENFTNEVGTEVHSSALPIGFEASATGAKLERIDAKALTIVQNSILAISQLDSTAPPEQVLRSAVQGFIFVSDVDDSRNIMTVLSPIPRFQPTKALIMGSFKWQDA